MFPLTGVHAFASLAGAGSEAHGFRTWEMEPAGWLRLSGSAGLYTIVLTDPAGFARPLLLTNVLARDGEEIGMGALRPRFDLAVLEEKAWDRNPAAAYYGTFVARGSSITGVGFRLAADGVDGFGPGKQDLLVSIRRRGPGTPETWERVGPEVLVPGVDCGGAKNPVWSAGWCSGEAPTVAGETYAVAIRPAAVGGSFQTFWKEGTAPGEDCWRVAPDGKAGFAGRRLWLAVAADNDGLLIPYGKRVHERFRDFAGFRPRWAQTYVARGRGLAAAILYAAVGGTQPPLSRQRCAVRVRRDGPGGPPAGIEKIAIGNGNYTGDASWGVFGAAFAPGEVPLEPGRTYAIEFETIETPETLRGYVNIKGQVNDLRPGFNPYRKCPSDDYAGGTAYAGGTEAVPFDLDLQVIEYERSPADWADAEEPRSLIESAVPWKRFTVDPGTAHAVREGPSGSVVLGIAAAAGKTADGGFVRRVAGLSRAETYRLSCRVRATWAVDDAHRAEVGIDPTGQDGDPNAPTIAWTALPGLHGVDVPFRGDPVRPSRDAVSVWVRARTSDAKDLIPYSAEFSDLALRKVPSRAPGTEGKPREPK